MIASLQPFAPYDATVTLPGTIEPGADLDLSPARLNAIAAELRAVRLECLGLARRRHELAFAVVGHNEIAALNARLAVVQALNLTARDYHRVARVTAWPTPAIPTTALLSPADLIPYLDAALGVLEARHRFRPQDPDAADPDPADPAPDDAPEPVADPEPAAPPPATEESPSAPPAPGRPAVREGTVTAARAVAHETLVTKLEALLAELRPLAARHPAQPVPQPLATLAEALLFDTRPFLPRRRREKLPAAAPDYAGLVIQLGQALAGLDAFEVRHTYWSAEHTAFVWRLNGASGAPVARLRPRLPKTLAARRAGDENMREKVRHLIRARIAEAYEEGLAAGRTGSAPKR